MDSVDGRLLARMQADFPLVARPFAALADELGMDEEEVLGRARALHERGLIRRIGPVLDPAKAGRVGTLAAMAVPAGRLEAVAALISRWPAVTHNYERAPLHGSCPFNLWFTLTARSREELDAAIDRLAEATGLSITALPTLRRFKIGVRFDFGREDADG